MAEGTLVVPAWEPENCKSIRKFVSTNGLRIRESMSFSKISESADELGDFIDIHGVEMLQRAREHGNRRGMNLGIAYPSGDSGVFYLDVHYYQL